MSFFNQLSEKPWVASQRAIDDRHSGGEFSLPTTTLGLRVFLAVVAVLFSLLVVSYVERMDGADWRSVPDPWLLWLNTVVLILSSVAMEWARVGARRGQIEVARNGLHAGGIGAFAFLGGQFIAWQQLVALGYFADTNPAAAFFYLLTALHGLHLLGGLVAWGRTIAKLWHGFEIAQVRLSVELCAVYWHFLLLVWLILFGLLLFT